jgi:hypothetical protein
VRAAREDHMDEKDFKHMQRSALRTHFDADDTIFLERELTVVRAKVIETIYLPAQARAFVPKANDIPESADTYVYKTLNVAGKAKMISYESKDLPRVDVGGKEILGKVRPLGAAWAFNINELKEAVRTRSNLAEAKPRAARDTIERQIDDVLAYGAIPDENGIIPDVGLQGLANNPLVEVNGIGVGGNWFVDGTSPMTPQEMLDNVEDFASRITTRSNSVFEPDTLLLPTVLLNRMKKTVYSPLTGETVLTVFRRNNPNLTTIAGWWKLNTAGAGGVPRAIAYRKDPAILEGVIPQEFEVLPPQPNVLEILYNCHARCGGVKIYQPMAVYYMDFPALTHDQQVASGLIVGP